jgi:hypothetical protein
LLYGQLAGASSLREIVGGLESHAAGLYHLGGSVVKRSTLAEANAQRPSAVFSGLLSTLMKQTGSVSFRGKLYRGHTADHHKLYQATEIRSRSAATR